MQLPTYTERFLQGQNNTKEGFGGEFGLLFCVSFCFGQLIFLILDLIHHIIDTINLANL